MHDQRKVRQDEIDEKTRALTLEKINRFRELHESCFALRDSGRKERDCLKELDKLLEINPELYTMYNYRRNILEHLWSNEQLPDAADRTDGDEERLRADMKSADLDAELEHNTRVITKDYKVYSAWLHRKWILKNMPLEKRVAILVVEAKKCEGLLKLDERNFHAWGYRRFVTEQLRGTAFYDDVKEMEFTDKKIASNFSNYSAWHNRAMILQSLVKNGDVSAAEAFLQKEIELVIKAFYCDPADQSAWIYTVFLVDTQRDLSKERQNNDAWFSMVSRVLSSCMEIVELEEEEDEVTDADDEGGAFASDHSSLKWPYFMRHHLYAHHEPAAAAHLGEGPSVGHHHKVSCVRRMRELDPLRKGYYEAILTKYDSKRCE